MNTSRVPGFTRNSGWQAVAADIARNGEPRMQEAGPAHPTAGPPADRAADQTGPRTTPVVEGS